MLETDILEIQGMIAELEEFKMRAFKEAMAHDKNPENFRVYSDGKVSGYTHAIGLLKEWLREHS